MLARCRPVAAGLKVTDSEYEPPGATVIGLVAILAGIPLTLNEAPPDTTETPEMVSGAEP